MSTTRLTFIATLFSASIAVSCGNPADSTVFAIPGASEAKPVASQAPLLVRNGLAAANQAASKVASVSYLINVKSKSGDEVCSGKAAIDVMSDFTMTFPTAKIKCLTLSIDLAGILGAGVANAPTSLSNISSDGQVLSMGEIANATFAPARPFLLGPVVQDASIYKNFSRTVKTKVTVNEPGSTLHQKSAEGQFDLNVIPGPKDILTTYSNTLSDKNKFDKVLHWTMAASGFDGIPAKNGLLLKKMEWYWNVQPIMIPKLVIVGELAGFIDTGGSQSSINQLVGDVTINLTVESFQFN